MRDAIPACYARDSDLMLMCAGLKSLVWGSSKAHLEGDVKKAPVKLPEAVQQSGLLAPMQQGKVAESHKLQAS